MDNTKFTALGLAGSGKTCYILGLYYKMCVGTKGFILTTENDTASKLEDWMDILDDETGSGRFPVSTAFGDCETYKFNLSYKCEGIISVEWLDYAGETLKKREKVPTPYNELNNSIKESTALYVFIDGSVLCKAKKEERKKGVEKQARTLNKYIQDFIQKCGKEKLPPIVFVWTKSDMCLNYFGESEMEELKNESCEMLVECFSSAFGDNVAGTKKSKIYITDVSLGKNISDDNYSGEADPDMHVPFFIGIYHTFLDCCMELKFLINEADKKNQKTIRSSQAEIDYQKSRLIFHNYNKINSSEKKISEATSNIEENKKTLEKYKRLLNAVAKELESLKKGFTLYENGSKKEFTTDEISYF